MGYDIVGYTTLKDRNEKEYGESVLVHIQCPYSWQSKFRNAIGCEITDFRGRLTNKNYMNFVNALDNIIHILENGESIIQFRGNLSNCPINVLMEDFIKLKQEVLNRKVRYVSIS
jgi:hypothetical protein